MSLVKILSDLTPSQLEEEASNTTFPKWNTLCVLRSLRLPTLNAAYLPPTMRPMEIETALATFSDRIGAETMVLRSDGGRETASYYRGGNTFSHDSLEPIIHQLHLSGRAIILMEPTNRFSNRLAANFLADRRDCCFIIELLGPGYDVADLNRGGIPPQYVIHGRIENWDAFYSLALSDIRAFPQEQPTEDERRRLRLSHLGTHILPGRGVEILNDPAKAAEQWLAMNNYNDLWRPWQFSLDLHWVRQRFEDAFMVALTLSQKRRWATFVLPWSVLDDGRGIYWDIVDPSIKYSFGFPPHSH